MMLAGEANHTLNLLTRKRIRKNVAKLPLYTANSICAISRDN